MIIKIILILILLSCIAKDKTPEWYKKTQENTEQTLYGYGAASSKAQAIEDALADLKQRIYTSLSSHTFMQDKSINGNNINEYSRTVKSKVPDIPIANYSIQNEMQSVKTYYIQVYVYRQSLVDVVHEKLRYERQEIEPIIQQYSSTANEIHKVELINTLKNKCDKHMETERFYNSLGFATPNKLCTPVYKTYHNFKIDNIVEIANTHPLIQKMLTNVFLHKFTVAQKSHNVITYKTNIQTKKINDMFIAGVKIDIFQQNTNATYPKHCIGNSTKLESDAIEKALQTCIYESYNVTFEKFFNLDKSL
ncbi:MAG: hypothetical protein ACI9CD_000512 [Candidatus Deianiraeaceae bacterium]|jgi:hypothetical protein